MAEGTMIDSTLIEKHLAMVLEANETTNLTRIDTFDEGMLLHVEDSLAGLEDMLKAPQGLYGDMGTGGGYPGIPLAIVTGRETFLIDSVRKKTDILQEIVHELGLQDFVTVYNGRIEDLAKQCAGEFAVLTARALSRLASLMELAAPLLRMKGQLICYKAQISEDELQQAIGLEEKLGLRLLSQRTFMLSDNITSRCIVVFEKVQDPTIKLPRKTGLAQKRPLR